MADTGAPCGGRRYPAQHPATAVSHHPRPRWAGIRCHGPLARVPCIVCVCCLPAGRFVSLQRAGGAAAQPAIPSPSPACLPAHLAACPSVQLRGQGSRQGGHCTQGQRARQAERRDRHQDALCAHPLPQAAAVERQACQAEPHLFSPVASAAQSAMQKAHAACLLGSAC